MNKLLGTVLTSALTISLLAGCGTSSSNKKKVGIIQFMDHTSLNEIKDSFDKEMKTLGYDDKNIEYTFKNGQGDTNTCASIANDFAGKNFDCVMAIATPAAQAVAKLATKTPVVFSAVTDPVGAQLTSSLTKPDKNITGTSDEVQVDQIIDKALEINPNTKTIGMLYNKGEANSVTNIKKAKAYCAKKNIKVEEATIASVNEAQSAVNVLNSKCDAIFAPNDNTVASAMNVVSDACKKANKPLYVGADSMVKDGGFLSVGIDYKELGKETAKIVDKVLKGNKVENIPVKVFKTNLKIYVNTTTKDKIGIKLPENITSDSKYTEI